VVQSYPAENFKQIFLEIEKVTYICSPKK